MLKPLLLLGAGLAVTGLTTASAAESGLFSGRSRDRPWAFRRYSRAPLCATSSTIREATRVRRTSSSPTHVESLTDNRPGPLLPGRVQGFSTGLNYRF